MSAAQIMPNLTKRQQFEITRSNLKLEQQSFLAQYEEINQFVSPRSARFMTSDVNRGDRRNKDILDCSGTLASRSLRAGMLAAGPSPARIWAQLTTPYPELNEYASVKEWLFQVTQRMFTIFSKSNLYKMLPMLIRNLGDYGTGAMLIEEDEENIVNFTNFPIGEFMLANDHKGRVRTFFREFPMTVRALIQKFATRNPDGSYNLENISQHVRNLYYMGQHDAWVIVCHIIDSNPEFNPHADKSKLSKYKEFRSCYYEAGTCLGSNGNYMQQSEDVYLRESGYDYFPVLAPRWELNDGDAYGTECPGMIAVGDIKQLQHGESKSLAAIDKQVDPPMTGPAELLDTVVNIMPGGFTADGGQGDNRFRQAHETNLRLDFLEGKQTQVRQRIDRAYYVDLFELMKGLADRQRTAEEIKARDQERLLALGPVVEQMNGDLHEPLIQITFHIMKKRMLLPEAPEELQDVELKIDYLSILSQAQKLGGLAGLERFAQIMMMLIGIDPRAADKFDTDQTADVTGEMCGLPPGIVRSDDKVKEMREASAKAAAAEARAAQAQQVSTAARNLSQTSLDGNNALNELIGQAQAGQALPV